MNMSASDLCWHF